MAKPATAEKQELATNRASVPAHLMEEMEKHAGKGVSTRQEDQLVPLIYVLQPLSKQLARNKPEYIEGAKSGDIYLRNFPDPIVPGDEGIEFQPCHFSISWNEWIPREAGGGFVSRHAARPADAKEQKDPKNPNRVKYIRPNGNEVIETRNHVGFVITANGTAVPFAIPFASTGHTVSRNWMTQMNLLNIGGKPVPSFGAVYRLKTKERSNVSGTWNVLEPSFERWVANKAEIERGAMLFEAVERGEKQLDVEEGHTDEDNSSSSSM